MSKQRVGFFGGSFDPVHAGHLRVATACQKQASLDEVWFVPNAEQPFKPNGPLASAEDRTEMLNLALADLPFPCSISLVETNRGGVSYTVDTLQTLTEDHPSVDFYLMLGADSLEDFPDWKDAATVCNLATPLVVARPGAAVDFDVLKPLLSVDRLKEIQSEQVVQMEPTDVSSSEIRHRVQSGQPIDDMVPATVADYIRKHGLYR